MTGHAWLDAGLAIAVGMLVFWLLLVTALALSRPQEPMLRAALRLLPDLVHLLHRDWPPTGRCPSGPEPGSCC